MFFMHVQVSRIVLSIGNTGNLVGEINKLTVRTRVDIGVPGGLVGSRAY